MVTGINEGTVDIIATSEDGGLQSDATVTVNPVAVTTTDVTGITLSPEMAILDEGENLTLSHRIIPANATNQNVSWSSSDTTIATVDQNGAVLALTPGNVVITVITEDGNYTATSEITVDAVVTDVSVTNIRVKPQFANIEIGETTTLTYQLSLINI